MPSRPGEFPPQAVSWLVNKPARILVFGASATLLRALNAQGHRVTVCDHRPAVLQTLCPAGGPFQTLCARADALPLVPHCFDVILAAESLHQQSLRVFSEWARALTVTGSIAVLYTTRDDTVPWVRRLAAIVQQFDPEAMIGDYGTEVIDQLRASRYFPNLEEQAFRIWYSITKTGLLAMISNRAKIQQLSPEKREPLLQRIAELYDSTSRAPEPLLLPYQVKCWRASVCQSEMSVPITYEDGLRLL